MMKLGLALPQFARSADIARVAEFAREAEKLGYDSLWVGDRLLTPTDPSDLYPVDPKPYPPEFTTAADPFVVWAAAAAATTTVRLNSSTLNAPWYNPVLLARSLTSLDVISNGRLDVGVGTSWMRDEYTAAGVEWKTRGKRLDETIELLRAWWNDNPVEFHGKFVDLPESVVDLRPVQAGGPPLYFGGYSDAMMERLGRVGTGHLRLPGIPEEYLNAQWDRARRAAETAGRDPEQLRRVMRFNLYDADPDQVEAQVDPVRTAGYEESLFELTYSSSSVDEALEQAGRLIERLRG